MKPHSRLLEGIQFARESLRSFRQTGSLWPAGAHAANALTFPLRNRAAPMRVLELGPGTGSITSTIVSEMQPGDSLAVCEISSAFMSTVRERLSHHPSFQTHRERIEFYECAAQTLPTTEPYDVIICSLPFLNFEVQTVASIFHRLAQLSKPTTVMTLYEYVGFCWLNKVVATPQKRRRVQAVERFLDSTSRQLHSLVWRNAPPMHVFALDVQAAVARAAPMSQ